MSIEASAHVILLCRSYALKTQLNNKQGLATALTFLCVKTLKTVPHNFTVLKAGFTGPHLKYRCAKKCCIISNVHLF